MGITQNDLPKSDTSDTTEMHFIFYYNKFFMGLHNVQKIMVYTFISIAIVTSGTIQCILLILLTNVMDFFFIYNCFIML